MESNFNNSLTERLPKGIKDLSYDSFDLKKYISNSIISFSPKEKLKYLQKPEIIKYEFMILEKITDNDKNHIDNLSKQNKKDRYSNIRTYKYNLVQLKSKEYINASFIHLPLKNYFIATQGPINSSINDFLEMIIQYNSIIIIMLCNEFESGREKCCQYWKGKEYKETKNKNLIIRDIIISKYNIKRIITQIQYIGWPEHGIPKLNEAYDSFINIIDFIIKNHNKSPVIVHCSAGVGRTGTFLSIFNIVHEIIYNKRQDLIKFSIFNTVRKLKEFRMLLVQNEEQYYFIYKFIEVFLLNRFETQK